MNLQQNVDRTGRWLYGQIKRVHPVRNKNLRSGKRKISNGIYVNRAIGCNCHYCAIDGDIDAGTKPGKETGKISGVSDEPAPMEPGLVDVLPG